MPIHGIVLTGVEAVARIAGPIIVRELSKPRTRRFLEDKVGELATEIARRRFTEKSSKKQPKRGGKRMIVCRRVSR